MVTAPSQTERVTALADTLTQANGAVYLAKMQELARAFGLPPPQDLTDEDALLGIEERALVSAQSIVQTQAERAAALIAEYGSGLAAQPHYDAWARAQADLIAQYESALASSMAVGEWIERNAATGTAHAEPTGTAGLDDSCDAAVAAGEVPIDQLDIDLPAHPRCPHAYIYRFDVPASPGGLWFGQADA